MAILHDRTGSVALEFAILVPVFLIFIFGLIEIGLVVWVHTVMSRASEVAEKYMIETKANFRVLDMDDIALQVCDTVEKNGLSCERTVIAVFPFDDPEKPLNIPALVVRNAPILRGDNFIVEVAYNWSLLTMVTPLLVPAVSGVHQIRNVSYVATAERPIE